MGSTAGKNGGEPVRKHTNDNLSLTMTRCAHYLDIQVDVMKLSAAIGRSSDVEDPPLILRLWFQGSNAQLPDNDPFHFSSGFDGGVKVSGDDNFAASDNEIRHLLGARLPKLRHYASRYM